MSQQRLRDKPRKRDAAQVRNDEIDARLVAAASAAIVEQLKRVIEASPARAIRSLVEQEVAHIAIGCISAYILKRAEIEAEDDEFNNPVVDLFA